MPVSRRGHPASALASQCPYRCRPRPRQLPGAEAALRPLLQLQMAVVRAPASLMLRPLRAFTFAGPVPAMPALAYYGPSPWPGFDQSPSTRAAIIMAWVRRSFGLLHPVHLSLPTHCFLQAAGPCLACLLIALPGQSSGVEKSEVWGLGAAF